MPLPKATGGGRNDLINRQITGQNASKSATFDT